LFTQQKEHDKTVKQIKRNVKKCFSIIV